LSHQQERGQKRPLFFYNITQRHGDTEIIIHELS